MKSNGKWDLKIVKVLASLAIAGIVFFPANFVYAANAAPRVGTITPSSGSSPPNQAVNFTATYSDIDGWQNIKDAYLLINSSTNLKKCFYGYYSQNTNKIYLRNNANTAWLGGFAPGSVSTIENSYSKLDCLKTTVSGSGNTLTIAWTLTLKPTFIGSKKTYLKVTDDANRYNGWLQKGTWTITQLLSISVTPKEWSIGSTGINQTITMPSSQKITITNDGTTAETLELKLTNPPGWAASSLQGQETYVLSAIVCGTTNIPSVTSFNPEDIITTIPEKATATVFGYSESALNGASIPKASSRAAYLQFKSPTITSVKNQQDIPITITAQNP